MRVIFIKFTSQGFRNKSDQSEDGLGAPAKPQPFLYEGLGVTAPDMDPAMYPAPLIFNMCMNRIDILTKNL
jgi:hypothetical protein